MTPIVFQDEVRIPGSVQDLDSFRDWAKSDDFPDQGRYAFLDGDLWVDLMPEQLFTHNDVKFEFSGVIRQLFKTSRRGRFFGDGTLVTNVVAGLSTVPDGTIVLHESLENGTVQLVEAAGEGFIEITGSPDAVLEIVSKSSVRKDTEVLRELYHKAGIREYWLVDVRSDSPRFEILQYTATGYAAATSSDGWQHSEILAHDFRLTSNTDTAGNPEFTVQSRPL